MMPTNIAPSFPADGYPPPGYAAPPPNLAWPQAAPARPPQVPRPPLAQQPPPRVIRGQAPEEPLPPAPPSRPAPLRLPTPEALGVAAAQAPAGTDWAAAMRRLDQLGATGFRLEKLSPGGWRVTCMLPTAEPGRIHRIDAQAASDGAALRLALDRAEDWARQRGKEE
jgi:hypothetical protein